MPVSLSSAILPLAVALCWVPSAHEAPTEPPQEGQARVAPGPAQTADGPMAMDGKPATAGRVPEGTPKDALDLWNGMIAAVGLSDRASAPSNNDPSAFDLHFNMKRRVDGEGTQEADVRLRYLEIGPGLVSGAILEKSGDIKSVQMRGLGRGDRLSYWFRKFSGQAKTDGWISYAGRDYKEAREEVDSYATISFDIARLTEPESCRIVSLKRRAKAPESDLGRGWLQLVGDPGLQLPPNDLEGKREPRGKTLAQLANELVWLELTTPDFRLWPKGMSFKERRASEASVKRVVFGLDAKSNQPRLVIVAPNRTEALQAPGTVLVQTTGWFQHGPEGARATLPGRFVAYQSVENPAAARGASFDPTAVADLYMLDGGSLKAALAPGDFSPEDKK